MLGAAFLLHLGTKADMEWYRALRTTFPPLWIPPDYVFGIVWRILYTMIGIYAWMLWRQDGQNPQVRSRRRLFIAQMVLNWSWMPVFFHWRALGAALAIIVAMDILVWRLIIQTHKTSSLAMAWLLVPYGSWLLFATYLNAHFWWVMLRM